MIKHRATTRASTPENVADAEVPVENKQVDLTEEQFEAFKEYCTKFIQLLGLQHYSVVYRFKVDKAANSLAYVDLTTCDAQNAVVNLVSPWYESDCLSDRKIKEVAFHEVLHILLTDLNNVGVYDDMTHAYRQRASRREEHNVIHRLMCLMPD